MKCRPKEERAERVPFGSPTQKLNVAQRPGFKRRIFNDNWLKEPGRVQRAERGGYKVVDDPVTGMTVGTNKDGTEIKAIVMEIPEELYAQDQAAKEAKRQVIDKQIHRGKFDKNLTQSYGDVKINTTIG